MVIRFACINRFIIIEIYYKYIIIIKIRGHNQEDNNQPTKFILCLINFIMIYVTANKKFANYNLIF